MKALFKRILSPLLNERGETPVVQTPETPPAEAPGGPAEPKPGEETPPVETPPVVDWESDDNTYKKRYGDSQTQIQPLVQTLSQFAEYDHQTKTWKPKAQPAAQVTPPGEDFDKMLEGFDPALKEAVFGYTNKQIKAAIAKLQEETAGVSEFNTQMLAGRDRAMTEFGGDFDFAKDGKMNTESPLYRLANEIILNKYANLNPDGSFNSYKLSDAEYLAATEAYAILTKRAKTPGSEQTRKLGAIGGRGSKAAGVRKPLSYADYSKLSETAKDEYDATQTGVGG